MIADELSRMGVEALYLALWVSAPVLLAGAGIGLVVAVLSAMTQVREPALSFVPKLAAIALTLTLAAGWMVSELLSFTQGLWASFPSLQ